MSILLVKKYIELKFYFFGRLFGLGQPRCLGLGTLGPGEKPGTNRP
jgi:hypothetical protein